MSRILNPRPRSCMRLFFSISSTDKKKSQLLPLGDYNLVFLHPMNNNYGIPFFYTEKFAKPKRTIKPR